MARAPEIIVKVNWTQCTTCPFAWNQSEEMVDGWLTLIMCERFKTRRAQERCQLYIRASDAQFYSCLGWQCIHMIFYIWNHWVKHILWDHCPKEPDLPPFPPSMTQFYLAWCFMLIFHRLAYTHMLNPDLFESRTFCPAFAFDWQVLRQMMLWLRCCCSENMVFTQNQIRGQMYNCCFTKKQSYNMIDFPSSCDWTDVNLLGKG